MISKKTRVCKKNFLIKAKNEEKKYFCTGCHKSADRGCKQNFRENISYGYPQPKVWKSQEISGMGRLKIF